MADIIRLNIAGIYFAIQSKTSIMLEESATHYQPFLRTSVHSPGEIFCSISLEVDNMPDITYANKIFESGLSWSMYIKGEDYFLEYRPPAFENPFWIAHIDSSFKRVTVYCGERFIAEKNGRTYVINPVQYPLDQLLLMYILAQTNGGLLHASGINFHGDGFLFAGRSGAGKSTLSGQFLGHAAIEVLSDDRIAIRKNGSRYRIFGTPWPGDKKAAINKWKILKGIFFIHHGNENRIKALKPTTAFEQLMPVFSIPWYDKEVMLKILSFCEGLVTTIPAYEFYFKPDKEVVDFFEDFVSKEGL